MFIFKNKFNKLFMLLLLVGGAYFLLAASPKGEGSRAYSIVKNITAFNNLYTALTENYVDNVEPAKLMRAALDGMLKDLDPYTNYISEGQIEGYKLKRAGDADIGVELMQRDTSIVIAEVFEGLPAAEAGLLPGDVITAIDGVETANRSVADVQQILRGQAGSAVSLFIQRAHSAEPIIMTVNRGVKPRTSVPHFTMLNDKVGYVQLSTFLSPKATAEVTAAIEDLEDDGMEKMVFDLRFNGGGLLNQAVSISNLFLESGNTVVTTKGKTSDWQKTYVTKTAPTLPDMPLIVLTNGRSASASEIVAGTIQDYDRGVILGRRSFGKGLVQQTKDIGYNSKLKLTVAKYYLNSGRCVQAVDYSGRYKDGATEVPDSVLTKFTTENGRIVYDGSGVMPDVEVDLVEAAPLLQGLQDDFVIFDYANDYYRQHPKADDASIEDFTLTDADFKDFMRFVNDKEYNFKTNTEKAIENLERYLTESESDQLAAAQPQIKRLQNDIKQAKTADLELYKPAIMKLLKAEIALRYFYQKGRTQAALGDDNDIKAALALFDDMERYESILMGAQ